MTPKTWIASSSSETGCTERNEISGTVQTTSGRFQVRAVIQGVGQGQEGGLRGNPAHRVGEIKPAFRVDMIGCGARGRTVKWASHPLFAKKLLTDILIFCRPCHCAP